MGIIGALGVGFGMLWRGASCRGRAPAFLAVAAVGSWLAVMLGAAASSLELALSGTVPLATVLPRCSACTRSSASARRS